MSNVKDTQGAPTKSEADAQSQEGKTNEAQIEAAWSAFASSMRDRSRRRWFESLASALADPAGRVDLIRRLGAILRPYSGEAADYLESYDEKPADPPWLKDL